MKRSAFLSLLALILILVTACGTHGNRETARNAGDTPGGPYSGMEPGGVRVGDMLAISSHMSKSPAPSWTRDFEIVKLVSAGVGLMRTDFSWSKIEPLDDQWQWEGYDVMVNACLDAGIQVNALLDYGVDWARSDGTDSSIDPAVWADFNGHVADHFADRIHVYEIWNEQNTIRFWSPYPDPEHYGRFLKAGYDAIHSVDPEATVLFGGLSSMDIFMFGPDGLWNFLPRVAAFHPDICDWFDAMAIHPYTFVQQTMPELSVDIGSFTYPDMTAAIDHAREHLAEIGCPDKPVHLTEMGWPSLLIGSERQAAYLARSLLIAASKGIATFYWYTFWDGKGVATVPTEDYFGLFTWPGLNPEEKPTYHALHTANRLLGAYRYAGDLGRTLNWPPTVQALVFHDDQDGWILGLWNAVQNVSDSVQAEVPLHPSAQGEWHLYSQEGALLRQGPTGISRVDLALTGRVQYLTFIANPS